MPDDRKRCWLMEGCPSRTGVCYSCVPDGDDCPIWRWFKKQIVVRCKDCKYWQDNNGGYPHRDCKWNQDETPDPDDFCSAGERRNDDA